jgi:Tfp pilus assembly protein PilX
MKTTSESGIALVTALLVLVLLGAVLVGYVVTVNSDQSLITVDRDQNRAYYAAQAGLEKLTASLGTLFDTNYAPTDAQINALTATPPVLTGVSFVSPGGGSGYQISKSSETWMQVPHGTYTGLKGRITKYVMTSTAHTSGGGEVRMQRQLQTVLVPIFQFGIFSNTDLSFFAGPNFNFGGRVHTNGNLYLAEGDSNTLTLSDYVTAAGQVVRKYLSNGYDAQTTPVRGTVNVSKALGSYRALGYTEGSVTGDAQSAANEPTWTNLSIGTYNGRIRSKNTGATRLDLPLVHQGAAPIDLIRRPAQNSNEDTANPDIFKQRYFAMASLRILLSDTAADITSLPTVTATAPVHLVGNAPDGTPGTYYAISGAVPGNYKMDQDTPLIGGYIKIEMQDKYMVWHDVTNEILGLGIAGKDLTSPAQCTDQANAVIRLQRFKDSPGATCPNSATNYWPNVLYDTREGDLRDSNPTGSTAIYLGGVIHYIELDLANLVKWFNGTLGTSGTQAYNTTGYVVYFSDRRTNKDLSGNETGEYGFEDFVNPENANGAPNSHLDTGEDVNGNGTFDYYGELPQLPPCITSPCITATQAPLDGTARPWTSTGVTNAIARVNKPLFFRRALKLVNGATISLNGTNALAIASENPLYVQGNYNANGTFSGAHAACSLLADAVTLLSNQWKDTTSFTSPQNPAGRGVTANAYYRAAIVSGKGLSFPQPGFTGVTWDCGLDGGTHNFFRLLENWGGRTLNYLGSIVSLYYSRQALGTFKCCTNVYSAPSTRAYNFDTDFLTPSLLPPQTPSFRDVNITGFTRLLMPNQ